MVFKPLRIGILKQTSTKIVTNGANIRAVNCLKARTPNNTSARRRITIPKFIKTPSQWKCGRFTLP
jgi:hypothetical protein